MLVDRDTSLRVTHNIDSQPGGIVGIHIAFVEGVVMREYFIGHWSVMHVLLNSEVVNGKPEMERSGHGDGRKVGGSMKAGSNLIERGEVGSLLNVSDATSVDDGHAYVVDPLAADEIVGVPDRIEYFASRYWSDGVFSNQLETFLQFGWTRVFHPEEIVGLKRLAQTRCFDWREAMMNVVQEIDVRAKFDA